MGRWTSADFREIKLNNIFRLFDDTPDPVEYGQPNIALGDSFIDDKTKVYTVRCEELKKITKEGV